MKKGTKIEILNVKQRQKSIERELNCKFIRINPVKENFDIFGEI